MFALNERQENLLMKLRQSMENESNKNNIDDKIHNDITNKNVIMDKTNYNTRTKIICKRGEIFYSDLAGNQGSEQGGIRPVIIIQNDIGNRYSPTVIVAAITSQINKAKLPIHMEIDAKILGLPKDSVILFEQIRTLDKRRLKEKIGVLDETMMKEVDKALGMSVGLKIVEDAKVIELKEKTQLERLSKEIKFRIEEMLDDILTYEKAISKAKNESLIKNLIEQREAFLWSLQKFCEDNKLNYRDYYKMYKKKEEKVAM